MCSRRGEPARTCSRLGLFGDPLKRLGRGRCSRPLVMKHRSDQVDGDEVCEVFGGEGRQFLGNFSREWGGGRSRG